MKRLSLAGPAALVRQVDRQVWKVIPAPYLNQPAFYVASDQKPEIKPCIEMMQNNSDFAFTTLADVKHYLNYGVIPLNGAYHTAELLYGRDRFAVTLGVLRDREDREFYKADMEIMARLG